MGTQEQPPIIRKVNEERRKRAMADAVDVEAVKPPEALTARDEELQKLILGDALSRGESLPDWEAVPDGGAHKEAEAVPPELQEIFGKKVPSQVREMYGKLKSPAKRESYVQHLREKQLVDEAKKRKRQPRKAAPVLEAQREEQPQPASEIIPVTTEGTPHEKQSYLKALIARAEGKLYSGKEKPVMSERGRQLQLGLEARSESLNEKAREYGPKVAAFIRSGVEKYNKLHWLAKLAVTGGLVAGVSLTSAVAPIASGVLATALYGQRAVGAVGFAMNQRKKLDAKMAANPDHWLAKKIAANPEHWLAKRSELMKNVYSTLITGLYMGGTMLGVHEGVEALSALGANELFGGIGGDRAEAASLTALEPVPVGMPTVEASPGHGYEYMMKRLWEQLREQNEFPDNVDVDSDLGKLLAADESTIDSVVHQIASDPSHGFFHADGTSVRIDPSAHMTIVDGNVQLDGGVEAPADASVTPALHPEMPAASDEGAFPPVEPYEPSDAAWPAQELPASPSSPAVIEHVKEFVNQNKLPIDPLHGHVFQDPSGTAIAYGNDYAARFDAAQEFAKAHPNTSVWVQAEEPVLHEGKLQPWIFEVKYGGWWRGMQVLGADGPTDADHIGAIDPDTFTKQLDT